MAGRKRGASIEREPIPVNLRPWNSPRAAAVAAHGEWAGQGPVDLPATAYIALGLGVVFTLLLGCGLMALVFFSSRRGHDERAGRGPR